MEMQVAVAQDLSLELKAKLFRGLADPSRLAILEALRSGEKMVSEIVLLTRLSQPNVSGHLTCLKDCGLLTSRQEGRCVFYAIADARMATLMEVSEDILSRISERMDRCSNYECRTTKKCMRGKKCSSTIPTTPLGQGAIALSLTDAVTLETNLQPLAQVGQ